MSTLEKLDGILFGVFVIGAFLFGIIGGIFSIG